MNSLHQTLSQACLNIQSPRSSDSPQRNRRNVDLSGQKTAGQTGDGAFLAIAR